MSEHSMVQRSYTHSPPIAVAWVEETLEEKAAILAQRLGLPCLPLPSARFEFIILVSKTGLAVKWMAEPRLEPLTIDLASGSLQYRRSHGGGIQEPLARAVGIRGGFRPAVLDATAGTGRDSLILAGLGCRVHMTERHPVIGILLEDGLGRAMSDPELGCITRERMILHHGDCRSLDLSLLKINPDVIYLDPMYPHRAKSALVKKEMRMLRRLAGDDEDSDDLLRWALEQDVVRVAVKRPKGAPPLAGIAAHFAIRSKNHRFDIYLSTRQKYVSPREKNQYV